jgi:hypothetical protein
MNLKKIIISVAALTTPFFAHATTLTCDGTVDMVSLHQPGFVGVKLSSMNAEAFVCRIDADYTPAGAATISPAMCKTIYAGLLSAKANKWDVTSVWFDGDQVPTSCTAWAGGFNSQVSLRYLPMHG